MMIENLLEQRLSSLEFLRMDHLGIGFLCLSALFILWSQFLAKYDPKKSKTISNTAQSRHS